MTTELHQGPLEAAPAIAQAKPTRREQRRARRRRRIWFEEILGWILVHIILFALYWAVELTMRVLGTSTSAIMDGIQVLLNAI
jgi:hypothetical protein